MSDQIVHVLDFAIHSLLIFIIWGLNRRLGKVERMASKSAQIIINDHGMSTYPFVSYCLNCGMTEGSPAGCKCNPTRKETR